MSHEFHLQAKTRTDLGKGASRRLRRLADEVPAVVYGGGKAAVSIMIPHKDMLKATSDDAFFSQILALSVDGKKEQVLVKALQRHPSRPRIMHADFQRVKASEAIQVKVPVVLLNEDNCTGVKLGGGTVMRTLPELEIICLPKDLPESLEIDIAELGVGESVHISQINFPKGVTSADLASSPDSDHAVVTIQAPRGGSQDDEAEGETEGEGEGEA